MKIPERPHPTMARGSPGAPAGVLAAPFPPVLKDLAVVRPQPVQGQTENFPQLLFFFFPAASFASVGFSFCSLPPSKFIFLVFSNQWN